MKQFYVVPINGDVFSLTTSALNVGCMYFVTYISTDISGQWVQGSADLKKGDEVGEQHHARRGEAFGGYPIPQEKLANTKIPCQKSTKCQYRISFRSRLLEVYPSRVFVHLKHLCTSNQPQPLWGNVRWPRIQSVQQSKRTLYQFHLRLSVKLCNHLPLIY